MDEEPGGKKPKTKPFEEQVKEAIGTIRPFIQMDGGDLTLVKIEGKKVYVTLSGACVGCAMAPVTLTQGVERVIKSKVPEVEEVIAVDFI
ncbi:Fe/S biogenesis protein NfuA [uncultured archaeon]|nr:Fe/S biogenesis protein NfuA [uncultured archaeon]